MSNKIMKIHLLDRKIEFIYFLNKDDFIDLYKSGRLKPILSTDLESIMNHPTRGNVSFKVGEPKKTSSNVDIFKGKEVYRIAAEALIIESVEGKYLAIGYSTLAEFPYDSDNYSGPKDQVKQNEALILQPASNFLSLLRANIIGSTALFPSVVDLEEKVRLSLKARTESE